MFQLHPTLRYAAWRGVRTPCYAVWGGVDTYLLCETGLLDP
jgi:hypothetical protein